MFESIVRTSRGASSLTESLGLEASDVAVIETDGTIEQADSIKVAYDGAPATGYDIFRNALSEAAGHPAIQARQLGVDGLSDVCRRCPVVASCGGGLYAHRYKTGSGFDNPSVYCADLEKIITHVQARIIPARPATAGAAAAAEAPGQPRPQARPLPEADFDALAAGFGDADSIGQLIKAQRIERRQLLQLLPGAGAGGRRRALPGRLGAARSARQGASRRPRPGARAPVHAGLGGALPAGGAAAPRCRPTRPTWRRSPRRRPIRAGAPGEVTVPVRAGHVYLPTLGRLPVGAAQTAEITIGGSDFQVRTAAGKWDVHLSDDEPEADWQPVRELRSGDFAVRLEDTDPYRDCHQWPVAPRLAEADVARWQEQFAAAWALIESDYPAYAAGLRAGLSTIMPLSNGPAGPRHQRRRQAGVRRGGGRPPGRRRDPGAAAHPRVPAREARGDARPGRALRPVPTGRLFYAPWRDDPRPIEAMLQGAYAHLGRDRLLARPQASSRGAGRGRGGGAVRPLAQAHRRGDRHAGRARAR